MPSLPHWCPPCPREPLPPGNSADFSAPTLAIPVSLTMHNEDVTLSCHPGSPPSCDVVSHHVYLNPGDADVTVSLLVDRVWTSSAFPGGQLERIENGALPPFTIPPGGQTTVELRGVFVLTEDRPDMIFMFPALMHRHPLLATNPTDPHPPNFAFIRSSSEHFENGVGEATLTVSPPPEWQVEVPGRLHDPDETAEQTTDSGSRDFLSAGFVQPYPSLHHGGPFLGVGGAFGHGLHGRIGYEIGFHPILLASLTLETDFQEEFGIAPLVEAALPSLLWFPSLGLGVGMPVRFVPDLLPGFRVQLTASFRVASFVTSFDYFPADGAGVRVTLLGQVGL